MKLLVVFAALLGLALGEMPGPSPIALNYHENIGIKEAARIQAAEQAADFDGSRIVGGSPAGLGQYPHLGGLVIELRDGRRSVCGSSLLTNTRALTAAHCWFDGHNYAARLEVVLGSTTLFHGGTRIWTNNVRVHPNYSTSNLNNDIAMIILGHVHFTNIIQPIALPTSLSNNNFVGWVAQAAGFGATADNAGIHNNQFVSHVDLPVISNADCARTYGTSTVVSSTLCVSGAGGKSTCGGDSGGPLSVVSGNQRVLIGVVSFGHIAGCQRGHPAGFARVTSFLSWIQNNL